MSDPTPQSPHLDRDTLLSQLQPSDLLLASFPRSGNTWLRFILADLLIEGHGAYPDDVAELNRIVFDIYKGLGEPRFLPFRIVKVHDPHPNTDHRFIKLVRSPADALVSYYHFDLLTRRESRTADGVDAFALNMMPSWNHVVRSYIDALDQGRSGILITYEDMHRDPHGVVSGVCAFIGIDASARQIDDAIERRSFQNFQRSEDIRPLHITGVVPPPDSERFFRKGEVGSATAELRAETMDVITDHLGPTYQEAVARAQRP